MTISIVDLEMMEEAGYLLCRALRTPRLEQLKKLVRPGNDREIESYVRSVAHEWPDRFTEQLILDVCKIINVGAGAFKKIPNEDTLVQLRQFCTCLVEGRKWNKADYRSIRLPVWLREA